MISLIVKNISTTLYPKWSSYDKFFPLEYYLSAESSIYVLHKHNLSSSYVDKLL